MNKEKSGRRRGFTLVEMMVAVGAGTLIMILVLMSFSSLSASLANTEHCRNMHQDIRHATGVMQRDITRSLGVSQCIASNRLALASLVPGSATGSVNVVYNLSSNRLFRTEGAGTAETLATGVEGVIFTLYDAAGAVTTVPSEAYFVGAEMRLTRQGVRDSYTDTLRIRNRMRIKGL